MARECSCGGHGSCVFTVGGSGYRCICEAGYTGATCGLAATRIPANGTRGVLKAREADMRLFYFDVSDAVQLTFSMDVTGPSPGALPQLFVQKARAGPLLPPPQGASHGRPSASCDAVTAR